MQTAPSTSTSSSPDEQSHNAGTTSQRAPVALLKACIGQQNDDAWQELSERFGKRIRNRLRRAGDQIGMPISSEEAHELCQDLFLSFFTCSTPFGGETDDEFWAYINQSVNRLAIDLARYRHAARRRGFAGTVPIACSSMFRSRTKCGVLASRERDPEHALMAKERVRALARRCLSLCDADDACHADAVRLTLFHGWTSRETSRHLDGTLTARQVDNVVGKLKKALDREGLSLSRRTASSATACFSHVLPPARPVFLQPSNLPIELRPHPSDFPEGF